MGAWQLKGAIEKSKKPPKGKARLYSPVEDDIRLIEVLREISENRVNEKSLPEVLRILGKEVELLRNKIKGASLEGKVEMEKKIGKYRWLMERAIAIAVGKVDGGRITWEDIRGLEGNLSQEQLGELMEGLEKHSQKINIGWKKEGKKKEREEEKPIEIRDKKWWDEFHKRLEEWLGRSRLGAHLVETWGKEGAKLLLEMWFKVTIGN